MAGIRKEKRKSGVSAHKDSVFFEEVMAFLLLAVIFIGLCWQGLLYEKQSVPVVILISVLSGIVLLKARLTGKAKLAGKAEVEQPFIFGIFFLLVFASEVSLLKAIHLHNAVYAVCKNCSLFLLVLAAQTLSRKIPLYRWLMKALTLAGLLIAALGLDAVWGGHVAAFLQRGLAIEGEAGFFSYMVIGDRLASVFQYPNTTASFLAAAWFASAHSHIFLDRSISMGRYRQPVKGRKVGFALSAGAANVILAAFLLTLSRGTYLVFALLLLVYIALLPSAHKGRSISKGLLCLVPGLLHGAFSLPGAPLRNLPSGLSWLILLVLFLSCGFAGRLLSNYAPPQKSPAKSVSPAWLKPKWIGISLSALCVCGILVFALLWQVSQPLTLGSGQTIARYFKLDKEGDYAVVVDFEQPIDESMGDLVIRLWGQDRQEMLRAHFNPYISANLSDYIGLSQARLPFTMAERSFYFDLYIDDTSVSKGNAITSVSIAAPESEVKNIKLGRFLISETLIQRIEEMVHPKTMYDRFGFYLDGFRIFGDFFLTGIGGDSWRFLYPTYQKHPYIANDIHSYVMQLFVEYGCWGLFVFLGFGYVLISQLVHSIKKRDEKGIIILMIAGGLFAHSAIDVDFAFYGQYLVFAFAYALIDAPIYTGAPMLLDRIRLSRVVRWGSEGVLLAVFILACLWAFRIGQANAYADAFFYSRNVGDQASATAHIESASVWDPLMPEYKAALAIYMVVNQVDADLALAVKADKLAHDAKKQGHYSVDTQSLLADYFFYTSRYEESWNAGLRAAEIEPYLESYWANLRALIDKILLAFEEESPAPDRRYWLERGLSIPREMERLSADRWVPVEPNGELEASLGLWQEELLALL